MFDSAMIHPGLNIVKELVILLAEGVDFNSFLDRILGIVVVLLNVKANC